MKIVNVYGPPQSGKTVVIKTMVDKIVNDLGLRILVLNNALTDGDEGAYSLPSGESSDVDAIRPFMVSGLITQSLLENVIIKVSPNIGVVRGSKLSVVEDEQVFTIVDLVKDYDLIMIESRNPLRSKETEITNIELIPPVESTMKRVIRDLDGNTLYVMNRYDHDVLRFKPKKFNAVMIPTTVEMNMVINGFRYELEREVSEAVDQLVDYIDGLDGIAVDPNIVENKSFLSKVRALTR